MVLCRKLIEGETFVDEATSGIWEYVWFTALPESGYEQAKLNDSVIEGINAYAKYADRPYNYYRYEIQILVMTVATGNFSGWGNLTLTERTIAAKMILAPKVLRRQIFSVDEDKTNATYVKQTTRANREVTILLMEEHIFSQIIEETITLANAQDFQKSVIDLVRFYCVSNSPDLKWFLQNTVGQEFANNGFAQKTYYTDTLRDDLMFIYDNY